MKHYAGVLILLISFDSVGQQTNDSVTQRMRPGKIAIMFCPLAALDGISFPTIQGGVELKLGRHFSWYNEFGVEYMTSVVDRADTAILRPRGIKVKTELRHFYKGANYFGFNAFLTHDAHNMGVTYLNGTAYQSIPVADFGVHKSVLGGNVVWGCERRLEGRFWVDLYGGVGVRFRYIRTIDDRLTSQDYITRAVDFPNIPTIRAETDSRNGWSWAPNITVGVRFVYRFGPIIKPECPLRRVKPPVLESPLPSFRVGRQIGE